MLRFREGKIKKFSFYVTCVRVYVHFPSNQNDWRIPTKTKPVGSAVWMSFFSEKSGGKKFLPKAPSDSDDDDLTFSAGNEDLDITNSEHTAAEHEVSQFTDGSDKSEFRYDTTNTYPL